MNDPDLAKGIEAQHLQLVDALETYDASPVDQADKIVKLLTFLEHYTQEHFALEEQEMAARRYPLLEGHAAAHRDVRARVMAVRARFDGEGSTLGVAAALRAAVGAMLHDQWVAHDRAFQEYLKAIRKG